MNSIAALTSRHSRFDRPDRMPTPFPTSQPPARTGVPSFGSDSLDISKGARARSTLAEMLDTTPILFDMGGGRRTKSLGEVRQDLQENFSSFRENFGGMLQGLAGDFADAGGIVLQGDGTGHVDMTTGEGAPVAPNRTTASGPFVSRFMVMAARASILDAASTEPGFDAAYRADAVGAVHDHIDALAERLLDFRLGVDENGFRMEFADDGDARPAEVGSIAGLTGAA